MWRSARSAALIPRTSSAIHLWLARTNDANLSAQNRCRVSNNRCPRTHIGKIRFQTARRITSDCRGVVRRRRTIYCRGKMAARALTIQRSDLANSFRSRSRAGHCGSVSRDLTLGRDNFIGASVGSQSSCCDGILIPCGYSHYARSRRFENFQSLVPSRRRERRKLEHGGTGFFCRSYSFVLRSEMAVKVCADSYVCRFRLVPNRSRPYNALSSEKLIRLPGFKERTS